MTDLDRDVDALVPWIARRQTVYRVAGGAWLVSTVITGLLVLLSDDLVYLPLIPVVAGTGWLTWYWGAEQSWAVRSRRTGHPVVRADLAWTVAAGRQLPSGWLDTPVPGEMHRTPSDWIWRPSRWVAVDVPSRTWPTDDVVAARVAPVWSPVLPQCAQLRLYLHGGDTIEMLVRDPSRLMQAVMVGSRDRA